MTEVFDQWRQQVDCWLREVVESRHVPEGLKSAMRYALFPGGKRLRALLTIASCVGSGGTASDALVPAAAVELVHCYSLVHDDMPEMDDSPVRRGKPALHKAFGPGVALLVGDALLTLGFELLGELPPDRARVCVQILARSAGAEGMVGGQYMDVFPPSAPGDGGNLVETALLIAALKTGRLFGAAAGMGWVVGSSRPLEFQNAVTFGEKLGLAYQILDDVEDWASGEDHGKTELPSVMSPEECRAAAAGFVKEALSFLKHFPVPQPLEQFVSIAFPKTRWILCYNDELDSLLGAVAQYPSRYGLPRERT